jgi:hypothetical protein
VWSPHYFILGFALKGKCEGIKTHQVRKKKKKKKRALSFNGLFGDEGNRGPIREIIHSFCCTVLVVFPTNTNKRL